MTAEENQKRRNEKTGQHVRPVVEGARGTLGHAIVEHDALGEGIAGGRSLSERTADGSVHHGRRSLAEQFRRHVHAARRRLLRARDGLFVPRPLLDGANFTCRSSGLFYFAQFGSRGERCEWASHFQDGLNQGDDSGRDSGGRPARAGR